MRKKVRADMILRQLAKRHAKDVFMTEVKSGSTWFDSHLRLDAVAIKKSWRHPCFTAYEVKVDRGDFLRDEKWPLYRQYCHRLFFACPAGLIAPEELPEDIGLIYYNSDKNSLHTKRQALFRDVEIPWEMLYYIIMCREESERHPFFSNTREFLEAWVQDKDDRIRLAYEVNGKLWKTIDELKEKMRRLEREVESSKNELELFKRVKAILERHGINTYVWSIEEELEAVLNTRMSPQLVRSLQAVEKEMQRVRKIINPENKEAV